MGIYYKKLSQIMISPFKEKPIIHSLRCHCLLHPKGKKGINSLGLVSHHYNDVIRSLIASQITSLTIVCSTGYSGADQRKHQSSASLAFVLGIHRWPVNSPHKGPVTRKMLPFDDVIMYMCRETGSSLVLAMACHLFGVKRIWWLYRSILVEWYKQIVLPIDH